MLIFFLSRKINDEKIGALWHRIGNYQTDLFQFGMIDNSGESATVARTWRYTWIQFVVGLLLAAMGFSRTSFGP